MRLEVLPPERATVRFSGAYITQLDNTGTAHVSHTLCLAKHPVLVRNTKPRSLEASWVGRTPAYLHHAGWEPVHTKISQPQTVSAFWAGTVLKVSLEEELSRELFVLHHVSRFLLGLLWVNLGDNTCVPAQNSQDAMLHQIDVLYGFLVSLPGSHLSNCLSAFNHASLHISIFLLWNLTTLLSTKMGFTLT